MLRLVRLATNLMAASAHLGMFTASLVGEPCHELEALGADRMEPLLGQSPYVEDPSTVPTPRGAAIAGHAPLSSGYAAPCYVRSQEVAARRLAEHGVAFHGGALLRAFHFPGGPNCRRWTAQEKLQSAPGSRSSRRLVLPLGARGENINGIPESSQCAPAVRTLTANGALEGLENIISGSYPADTGNFAVSATDHRLSRARSSGGAGVISRAPTCGCVQHVALPNRCSHASGQPGGRR